MNVVLVNVSLDPERGGGTSERTRHLATHLSAQGCRCRIIAMDGKTWLEELARANVEVWLTGSMRLHYPIPLAAPYRLWRLIRQADVIHIMGYWYLLAAAAFLVARVAGRPVALCPAGELTPFAETHWVKRCFLWVVGQRMIQGAASIICTTELEREQMIANYAVPTDHLAVLPNGIGVPSDQHVRPGPVPHKPYMLFMGRLAPIKGPDLLINAFARVVSAIPDLHLAIAGAGLGMRDSLDATVRELGLSHRVSFLGFVPEADRLRLYRNAAFLVVPSRSEVMSMVALEAGAAAIPVLLTDRCGFNEVEEIGGGYVVAADETSLALGIGRMWQDPTRLAEMGERLRQFVNQRYAWPIVAKNTQKHLAQVAAARPCDA